MAEASDIECGSARARHDHCGLYSKIGKILERTRAACEVT